MTLLLFLILTFNVFALDGVDWDNPTLSTYYQDFLDMLKRRDIDSATWFKSTTSTNIPTGAIHYDGQQIEYWTGSAYSRYVTDLYLDNLIVDSGQVGIGTTSPSVNTKLEIKSSGLNTAIQQMISSVDSQVLVNTRENVSGDSEMYLFDASESTKVKIGSNGDSYFNGGNVGIGTVAPLNKFVISNNNNGGIEFNPDITLWGARANYITSYDRTVLTHLPVVFDVGGTEATAIYMNNGRLGIGTSAPDSLLHVGNDASNPSIITVDALAGAQNQIIYQRSGTNSWWAGIHSGGNMNSDYAIGTANNDPKFIVKTSGIVGIGLDSPNTNAMLHIYKATSPRLRLSESGDTNGFDMYTSGNDGVIANGESGNLIMATNGVAGVTVGSSGDVGITNGELQITNGVISLQTQHTPTSASDTCTTGQVEHDSNYIYVCVATNTWKRTALSTW